MNEKHGYSQKDRIYRIWVAMRQRCAKTYRTNYDDYGGRGIVVCAEWDGSFPIFKEWAEQAGYKPQLSIDRIDVNGNYSPSNCRWATVAEQAANKRFDRGCLVEVNGKTKTVHVWAKETGIHLTTLYRRYRNGITGPDFLVKPVPKPPPITLTDKNPRRA